MLPGQATATAKVTDGHGKVTATAQAAVPVQSWMIQSGGLTALAAQPAVTPGGPTGQQLAARFFNRPSALVIGTPVPGYAATQVTAHQSYAEASATWAKTRPEPGSWVTYDNEYSTGWPTPANEQADPQLYMSMFCDLAKNTYGLRVICVPAVDLTGDKSASCYAGSSGISNEREWEAYLRCTLPAFGAQSDIFSVQSQSLQAFVPTDGNADSFAAMLNSAVAQLPLGHTVFGGLTTERGDSIASMVACYQAAPAGISGFWLNGNANTGPVLAAFLTALVA